MLPKATFHVIGLGFALTETIGLFTLIEVTFLVLPPFIHSDLLRVVTLSCSFNIYMNNNINNNGNTNITNNSKLLFGNAE